MKGILKTRKFWKHGILCMKGILKTRKFLKNVEFYNVEFENGRGFWKWTGFLKMDGVFENGRVFWRYYQ